MNFYPLARKLLFQLDAEKAHDLSLVFFHHFPWAASFFAGQEIDSRFEVNCAGMTWPFPVGLAAGLDKNASAIDFFSRLALGSIEIGTVTRLPQDGNPKPRLFRYPELEAIRNSMGINNLGMDTVHDNLLTSLGKRRGRAIGVNLSKNKMTSVSGAPEDYRVLYEKFAPVADYLVINVSSPNMPGLRDFQKGELLSDVLSAVQEVRTKCFRPLFVKIAPELGAADIKSIVEISKKFSLNGIIATNTIKLDGWGEGGVSGKPLAGPSRQARKYVIEALKECPGMELIGVGGFFSFDDVWQFFLDGGKCLQVYTSFIYRGPALLREIRDGLTKTLSTHHLRNLDELFSHIKDI